eukprot:s1441_g15.t1
MYLDQLENTGLAYINFHDHATAVECQRYFEGSIDWSGHISDRPCKAQWSSIQGYEANITRHRKAEWLEKNVPEDCKPMAFDEQGRRLPTLEVFTPSQSLHSTDSGKGGKYQRPGKGKPWEREWYGASKPHAGKGSNWPGWYTDRNIETDSRQTDSGYANAAFEPFDDSASWLQAAANWQAMEMTAEGTDDWGNPNEGNMASALDLYLASMDSTDRSDEVYGQAYGQSFEPTFPLQESFEKRADTFERDASDTKVDQKRLPKPSIPELPVLEHLQSKGSPQTSPQMSPSSTASEPGQLGLRKYACPNCKLIFAKWSACQHHLVSDMKCWCVLGEGRLPSDVTELQEKCKAAAEERPKDTESTAAFVDEAIQDKVLRGVLRSAPAYAEIRWQCLGAARNKSIPDERLLSCLKLPCAVSKYELSFHMATALSAKELAEHPFKYTIKTSESAPCPLSSLEHAAYYRFGLSPMPGVAQRFGITTCSPIDYAVLPVSVYFLVHLHPDCVHSEAVREPTGETPSSLLFRRLRADDEAADQEALLSETIQNSDPFFADGTLDRSACLTQLVQRRRAGSCTAHLQSRYAAHATAQTIGRHYGPDGQRAAEAAPRFGAYSLQPNLGFPEFFDGVLHLNENDVGSRIELFFSMTVAEEPDKAPMKIGEWKVARSHDALQ